jgi:hypothetical protein
MQHDSTEPSTHINSGPSIRPERLILQQCLKAYKLSLYIEKHKKALPDYAQAKNESNPTLIMISGLAIAGLCLQSRL